MPSIITPIPRRSNYGRPTESRFGPWKAGLVLRYTPELLPSNSLVQCENFDVLPNGELKVRPAFTLTSLALASGTPKILDTFVNTALQTTYLAMIDTTIVNSPLYIVDASGAAGITAGFLTAPIGVTVVGSASGTSSFGTYRVKVAAYSSTGSSAASTEVSITTAPGTYGFNVNWTAVTGASFYRVFFTAVNAAAGSENQYRQTTSTTQYIDASIASTAGTPPAAPSSGVTNPSQTAFYNGKLYVAGSGAVGGLSFDTATSIFTNVPTMPQGYGQAGSRTTLIFRDRMFLVGLTGSRVYFSTTLDPSSWTGTDAGFFDVGPNDGSVINSIIATRSSIYIFKDRSIYQLSYSSNPTDGRLDLINPSVGALSATVYENHVYFAGDRGVYSLINGTIQQLSYPLGEPVTLGFGTRTISVVYDRLMCGNYVYNLKSHAWSLYSGAGTGLNAAMADMWQIRVGGVTTPNGVKVGFIPYYVCATTANTIYMFTPDYSVYPDSAGGAAGITATMQAKDNSGDFATQDARKRIYAVTINLHAGSAIQAGKTASGNAVALINDDTINDASVRTLEFPVNYTIANKGYFTARFYASLRVHRYDFIVTLNDQGSMPSSIYSINALVKLKVLEQSGQTSA